MKKITNYSIIIISLFFAFTAQAAVQLIGIGNYFKVFDTPPSEIPRVTYSGRTATGQEVKGELVPLATEQGGLRRTNLVLPATVDIVFSSAGKAQHYQIVVEEVTNPNERLACQGWSRTVQARMTAGGNEVQKVCVPYTVSTLPTAVTGVKSGDFDNVALLIGPLGTFEKPELGMPFKFGLMAWTSAKPPWNEKTIDQAYGDNSGVTFPDPNELRVLQGFAALGGGPIPRAGFASINHIYNNTDNILILSRSSTSISPSATPADSLPSFNITQIVPPRSVMPYALVWIPNIDDKESLKYRGHDGVRVSAVKKPETVRPPDTITHSEIQDLDIPLDIPIPQELSDFFDQIKQSELTKVTSDAAELLGIKSWDQEMHADYRDFSAADNYYTIATVADEKKTHIQKCSVTNKTCQAKTVELPTPAFVGPGGIPNYYNLIAHTNENGEFMVSLYPAQLVSPR